MACVVSVKESPIKNGRLNHADLNKVWKDYPESLHKWLLRLTEEFDLTFFIPPEDGSEENINLVPCLLPESKPNVKVIFQSRKFFCKKKLIVFLSYTTFLLYVEIFFYMYNILLQFEWPEPDKKNGITETKMVYVFDYLPSGLFNRGQVKHYRQVFWFSFHNWLVFIRVLPLCQLVYNLSYHQ